MEKNYKLTYISCFTGYIVQAIGVNLAPIFFIIFQTDYGISYALLANLILITFGAQLVIDALSIKLCDILGLRTMAVIAHIMATLGLVSLGTLPKIIDPFAGIAISLLIGGVGSGFIEVIISPIIDAIPTKSDKSAMSFLHSFYCWGQVLTVLVSTVVLAAIGTDFWHFIPIAWATVPFVNLFLFLRAPLPEMVKKDERTPIKKLLKSRNFIIMMILMVCSGATEIAVSQWASLFAEKGLGVTKALGDLLGPCLFAVFMGAGRTMFGILGSKINLRRALSLCGAGAVMCYLVTVFVPVPIIGLFGCAMTGFCVSLMWPGTLSLGSELFPMGGVTIFSVAAICGDLGAALGPWIAGQVSDAAQSSQTFISLAEKLGMTNDQIGLRAGILVCIVFPLIMTFAVLLVKKPQSSDRLEISK